MFNTAVLFNSFSIFEAEDLAIGDYFRATYGKKMNLNKHIGKYFFEQSTKFTNTQAEADLKLGDIYYEGSTGEQSFQRAHEQYRKVINQRESEHNKDSLTSAKEQAYFNIALMHHFGHLDLDLDKADEHY